MAETEDIRAFYVRQIKASKAALPMYGEWRTKMIERGASHELTTHLDQIVADANARIARDEKHLEWLKSELDPYDP